jgi:hypothetical protein
MKVLLVFSLGLKKGAGASGQARLLLISAPAGSYRWALRILGSFLLVASAFQSIAAYGLGVGLVTFFSHACFAAWCVSLFLTWRRSLP